MSPNGWNVSVSIMILKTWQQFLLLFLDPASLPPTELGFIGRLLRVLALRKKTKRTRIEICLTFSSWYIKQRFLRRITLDGSEKSCSNQYENPVAPFPGKFLSDVLTEPDEGVSSGLFVSLFTISSIWTLPLNHS